MIVIYPMFQSRPQNSGILTLWTTATLLLIGLILTSFFSGTLKANTETCTLALTGEESPPYLSRSAENNGAMAEVVRAAFQASNCAVTFNIRSWARAIADTKQGVQDALIGAAWSEERNLAFLYSSPYYSRPLLLLKKKSLTLNWSKVTDLHAYTFAIVRDSFFSMAFNESQKLGVIRVADDISVIRLVLNDRISLGVIEEKVARSLIARHFPAKAHLLDFSPKPLATNNTHLIVSREHPNGAKIIQAFNDGLAAIKANGLYGQILARYQLSF